MEEQPTNEPYQSPPPPEQPAVEPPQPQVHTSEPSAPETIQPAQFPVKKSKKKLIIIVAIVAIVVAVAIAYAVYVINQPAKTSDKTDDTKNTAQSETTDNPTINSAKSLLTDIYTSESKLADTDQSSLANEVSSASSGVEGSVDENSF